MTQSEVTFAQDATPGRSQFSSLSVIAATYKFAAGHVFALARAAWLPCSIMTGCIFLAVADYFAFLARFLVAPNGGDAGLMVALLMLCVIVLSYLSVVMMVRSVNIVLGATEPSNGTLRAAAPQARLFAASLRLLVALMLIGLVSVGMTLGGLRFVPASPQSAVYAGWTVFVGASWYVCARCGVLMPALATVERSAVLRRAWKLTRGNAWALMLIWALLVVGPAVILQILGNTLLNPLELSVVAKLSSSWAGIAAGVASEPLLLFGIALLISATATLCSVLLGIGSVFALKALAPSKE